jgi:NADPH2:quinone reductase
MGPIPDMMRAAVADGTGGPEVLKLVQRPVPQPKEGEILIKVGVAGVNRPDVAQRQGGYPPPPGAPDILGLEIAGEVVAAGPGASRFSIGTPVMALVPGGGYADYAVAHESNALPIPQGLSLEEAGAIPETYFTVWTNVFDRGRLQPGETLLVHGGTSGIGTTAVNYRTQDFVAAVKEATHGRGADVILDMVGGDYISRNYEAAAQDGRIVQIAFLGGGKAEVDFRRLMVKRLTHTGSTLRPRSVAEKAGIARALESKVWPLLAQGRCRPVMDSTFALEDVAVAHARMDGGEHIGKIILRL